MWKYYFLGVVFIGAIVSSCMEREQIAPVSLQVSRSDFGGGWPLLAEQATLRCDAPSKAYAVIGDRICALNGKAAQAGMPRCDDAYVSGNAASGSVLVERALTLCPGHQRPA